MVCAAAGPVSAGPISAAPAMNASESLCHEVMGMLQERFVAATEDAAATKSRRK
jgi:hypothetical protein